MDRESEGSAHPKARTDEDVLWAKIIRTLGRDHRPIRNRKVRMLKKGFVDMELDGYNLEMNNQEFPVTEETSQKEGTGKRGIEKKSKKSLITLECTKMDYNLNNGGSIVGSTGRRRRNGSVKSKKETLRLIRAVQEVIKSKKNPFRKWKGYANEENRKSPGRTSYSQFKSRITRKSGSRFPVSSSPISTRWQQLLTRTQVEQTFAEKSPTTELSVSDVDLSLTRPVGKATGISVPCKNEGTTSGSKTFTSSSGLEERSKTKEQYYLKQMSVTGRNKGGVSGKGGITVCEKCTISWKAHSEDSFRLEPEVEFHVRGLRNDYYLNVLDWSHKNLIALGLESTVHVWNAEGNRNVGNLHLSSRSAYVASVAWMKENGYLAIGTSDGEVELWDIEAQKKLRNMFSHRSVIGAMSWNEYILSSGSRLGYIYHHDIRAAQHHVGMVQQSKRSVCSLQWSPDNKLLACGSSDGLLNIWCGDIGVTIHHRPLRSVLQSSAVKALMWCPWQTAVIATGGGMKDRILYIWNVNNMECLETANTESQVCSLLWLPNTKELLTGQGCPWNKMNIWKYPTVSKSAELYGHKDRVLHMALSPEGNKIFSAAPDQTAYVWKYKM